MATANPSLDRGMPASIEAERSILGAILLDNFAYNEAAQLLGGPDAFLLDSHRRIYARMVELAESGRAIDIITLSEELSRNKDLEAVGGVAYISSLTDGVPRRPSIEQYVKIVRDKALLRTLIHTANTAIQQAYEGTESAEEIIDAVESSIFQISENRVGKSFHTVADVVRDSFGSLDKILQRGKRVTGVATHYDQLDEMTSGLQAGDMVIIAARPSMGKTAFAINIAENAAIIGRSSVAIFSLEMSRESLVQRILCSQAHIDMHRFRTGTLYKEDYPRVISAFSTLAEARMFIDDTPGISLMEMRAKLRRLQKEHGLDLVVIDYLQLMSGGAKRYENRTQEVSAISRGLKALAKEMKVPVIALSQLSRQTENRGTSARPQLSDLRESGAIEQDADVVAFIYREDYYMDKEEAKAKGVEGVADIIIAKQRNGPTGTVKLAFIKASTRFENLAEDHGGGGGDEY